MDDKYRITQPAGLFDKNGRVKTALWADSPLVEYNPPSGGVARMRVKEYDSYLLISSRGGFAVCFTFADYGCRQHAGVSVYDFNTKEKLEFIEPKLFNRKAINLPRSFNDGSIAYTSEVCDYHIDALSDSRHLYCRYSICFFHSEMEADIRLQVPCGAFLQTALPGKNAGKEFYYSQRLMCMPASGCVRVGDREYSFDPLYDYGMLERSRSLWSYSGERFTGICSTLAGGKSLAYCIGSGLGGDVTENAVFINGECIKLGAADIKEPDNGIMDAWHITAGDGTLELVFTPYFNDRADSDPRRIARYADRLFGIAAGTVRLADGTRLDINGAHAYHEFHHDKF